MRIGDATLRVPQGRELDNGQVVLTHGTQYTVVMYNDDRHRRADVALSIDGKPVGSFRVDTRMQVSIEHPADDCGRFTFYRIGSAEADAVGSGAIATHERGLVQATFRFERATVVVHRLAAVEPIQATSSDLHAAPRSSHSRAVKGPGGQTAERMAAGVTGLSGHSDQRFVEVGDLTTDPALDVTITLRLVAEEGPRPLWPTPRSNPIPPAAA